ncbi:MAG: isoprenylcysteine carboxylmethyltransferase family protein [Leptolyngbya sp. SIO1D8]|nr:isoprenylcysteine carboxylmethyltransferase family protein [Leptolyngbya sp. SIO1D8]
MTITTILAYLLIIGYFVMERLLRKGQQALNLKPGEADAGSSQMLWICGVVSILLVIAAPILNTYQIGYWDNTIASWLGLALMLGGLTIRYWAAKTLGEFYTRTLQVIKGQRIINQAPYNIIRHPGYLGTLLMEVGGGFAVTNWVVLLVLLAVGIMSRAYRIRTEEKMLKAHFGEEYKVYLDYTWKLIPFLY